MRKVNKIKCKSMKIIKLVIIIFIFATSGVVILPSATSASNIPIPFIAQITGVPALTNDATPDYKFYTTKAGTITYGGSCSSATTVVAVAGYVTVTFKTLSQGIYSNCTIMLTDAAKNKSNILKVNTFKIDTVPETTILTMPAKQATSTTAIFTFKASEASTFQCKLDAGTYAVCTSPKTYTALTEGQHTFYVKAKDASGNIDATPAVYAWAITVVPETTILTMPAKQATSTTAIFTFKASEASTFQCKLDAGTYAVCASPKTYTALTEGQHTFYVKAIDSAGNMDITPAVYAWTIVIAPETTITAQPDKQSASADAVFNFTANEDSTFQCKLDSGTYDTCVSPQIYTSLTEGQHTFYVKAIDSAGNMDITPAVYSWMITFISKTSISKNITLKVITSDTVVPETTILTMPAKQATSTTAVFNFTANEDSTFQCKLDSGTYDTCVSPQIYTSLTEGQHTFYVKAIDSAGNMDITPAVYAWTIAIAPETTITAQPDKQSASVDAVFNFTANEDSTFQCKLDSGTYDTCVSPQIYTALTEGQHTFYVKAIDSAGNMDITPAVYAWTIAIAPETTIKEITASATTTPEIITPSL